VALAIVTALALFTSGAGEPFARESRPFAGGLATVTLLGGGESARARALDDAFRAFARVDAVMNEWRPESPLSALNAAAGSGAWVRLPDDLCRVLRLALDGARRTGGLFDPTWAALRLAWRFEEGAAPPDDDQLRALCPLVGWRAVALARTPGGACRARLPRAGMAVGLGGIAKGWAVDEAVRALRRRGFTRFLVQAGGDLYAGRGPSGRGWTVGIRDPRGPADASFARLELRDRAFSTSGDYEHFFEAGGRRYHHVIDPRTCRPADGTRSVTILGRSAVSAEILSKAAFVAGGDEGLWLVERAGAAAVLVTADNRVLRSPSLASSLRLDRAPTP
jgi:thiamine biosynthesis lipoprotein